MTAALTILRKDLRIEWRTRESLSTLLVLGVLLVVVFSVAHDAPPAEAPALAPAVFWTTFVLTALLGVQRGFLVEREQDCLAGLLGAPVDAGAIYAGKLGANLVLLGAMQAIVMPLVGIMLHVDMVAAAPALALVLGLGNLGFSALATLFAAIAVRLRAREVMLPVLLLPLVVPVLIAGVKATAAVVSGGGLGAAREAVGLLVAFDVIFTVAGWMLFEYVVRD